MNALEPRAKVEELERLTLAIASPVTSVDAPVFHRFGPGIYIREVHLPAGALVTGHRQRVEHLNIMLTGEMDLSVDGGPMRRVVAPYMVTTPPGRKVAIVIRDAVWLNVYPTEERDVEKLEAMYLDKSPVAVEHAEAEHELHRRLRQPERDDFAAMLAELSMTDAEVRAAFEGDSPAASPSVTIRRSPIDGRGVFLSAPAAAGDVLGPLRIDGAKTTVARWVNHGHQPNAEAVVDDRGDVWLVARRAVGGCVGGSHGEEVTVDYRRALLALLGG